MENGHIYSDDEADLEERSTSDLVEELIQHGKRLLTIEARNLRAELEGQLGRARGELRDSSGSLVADAKDRLAQNLAAVRTDLKLQLSRTTDAVKPMAAGGVVLYAGLLVLLAAFVLGLATLMPAWVAALIVGIATIASGAIALASGKKKLELVGKNPLARTHQQMTENKQWIDTTKQTVATKLRAAKSALSDVAWPKLPGSSGDGPSLTTSRGRLEAP